MKLLIGKYKGKDVADVANYDPQYVVWLAQNTTVHVDEETLAQCKEDKTSYEEGKEYDLHFGLEGW